MARKIPPDAFSFYFALGPGRSYQAVAREYGVSRQAVAKHAEREGWAARLKEMDQKTRERAEQKAMETVAEMNERHLKIAKVIQGRALEALRQMPLQKAIDAVRALGVSIDIERRVRGEPEDAAGQDIEAIIRREYEDWTSREEAPAGAGGGSAEAGPKAAVPEEANPDAPERGADGSVR